MKTRRSPRNVTPVLMLLAAIALLAPLPSGRAEAYEYPSIERGFKPQRAFHIGDIDNIRLFNGGLELAIPIGQRYTVGGDLSYRLTLSYGSQLWDYQSSTNPQGTVRTEAWPVRGANAGLGWRLSLGEFRDGNDPAPGRCAFCYIAPDGARHQFYDTVHVGLPDDGPTKYTWDSTYLRLRQIAGGWEIDFPNGEIHKFDSLGRVIQIRDRFSNRVDVTYGLNAWTITDTQGRTHMVNLVSVPHYGKAVGSVVLAAFDDTQAPHTFSYAQTNVPRSCLDDDPETSGTMLLPLLTSVGLPDGSTYSMPVSSYFLAIPGSPCDQDPLNAPREGLLQSVTLPTRGTVEWSFGTYNFPAPLEGEDPGEDPLFLQKTAGVKQRTLREGAGTVHGTWTYAQTLPGGQDAQESITSVTSPIGDRTDHYFRVGEDPNPVYGLPFSPLESAPGRPDLFRSSKIYDCDSAGNNCQLQRTTYLKYRVDQSFPTNPEFNPRIEASSTTFHDDGNRRATVDYSDFDGLSHYRTVTLSGNFPTGNAKTTTTNFNPTRGTYPGSFIPPTPSEPWVLETFDYREITEGGQTSREEFCFETGTGYLQRSRVLRTGTTHGATDLVSVFTRDPAGNTTREQRFGSDLGSVNPGGICTIGLGPEQYRMDHTYQYGSLATSQYFNAGGGGMGFFSVNRTIDRNTGLPSSSRDPALVTTTFDYDALGRPISVETGADAKTTYFYKIAQGTNAFANVRISRIQNAVTLSEEQFVVDHFGRPMFEKRKMASGAWSKRRTFHNAMGWVTDVAEWEPDGANHTAFTRYRNFDPFGRPRRIEPPDGAAHEIDLTFVGSREVVRSVKVATGANGVETNAFTTERYDRQGRLHQVVEPAGAGGTGVTTTYGYDERGRLSSVDMGMSQSRSFSYDNRGFLTSECHPEKGVSGNGCVTYGLYNAWGLPGRATDGPNSLRLLYDRAGRPTETRENSGQQRLLKQWTYGTGTGAGDRSNGRVKTADRYNYVILGTIPYTDLVRETYTYGGRSGRVSTRLTENFINPQPGGSPSDSFTQSFVWNDLGDPASVGYPHRLGLPVGRTVSFGYSNGVLTSAPGYASSITYHPNGTLNQVVHTNGITDVWDQDPSKMPRPASIAAWYAFGTGSQALRFSSGAYGYDGSGNVETIGNAYFVYDRVSRLVDARLYTGPGGGGGQVQQAYSFDAFGNIQSITTNSVTRNTPTSTSTNRLTSGTYDGAGNLTGYTGALYEYGPFNDLWHYKNGSEEALYLYTADGERLWEYNFNGKSRWTLRDLDGKVLREYSYDRSTFVWTVERDYIYRDGTLLATETPQGIRHFSVDHLGTPRLITNAAGNQVAYHAYYPFGEEATWFNQDGERMKFTGHERDLHSTAGPGDDLDYMHARSCSPVTGRFMSVDPHVPRVPQRKPQRWNRYSYSVNNPLNVVDPDGRSSLKIITLLVKGFKTIGRVDKVGDAARVVREGGDVMAPTRTAARDVAKEAGGGRPPVHDGPHGPAEEGFRPHYHPSGRKGGHVFYSIAGGLSIVHGAKQMGLEGGAMASAEVIDFVNPLSIFYDALELIDLLAGEPDSAEEADPQEAQDNADDPQQNRTAPTTVVIECVSPSKSIPGLCAGRK